MEDVTNQPAAQGNKTLWIAIGAIVVLALVAGGYYYSKNRENAPAPADTGTASIPGVDGEGPVARVDGTEIGREEYRRAVEQLVASYNSQGLDVSSAEAGEGIKTQAVDTLVNRQLVIAAAMKAGITADDQAVEAEYQNLVSSLGGPEQLAAALASANTNEEELRADLKEGVLINNYLAAKTGLNNLTVSDEEVTAYYETAKASSTAGVPELADVKDLIKNQLLADKQQKAIAAEVEKLRAEATIEILI